MKKTLRAAALAIVATLALAGCIRVEMNLTLNEDDTVDGSLVFAVEEGVGDLMELTDEEAVTELFGSDEDLTSDFESATVTSYNQDGFIGTQVTFEGEALEDFALEGSEITIVREGDEFVVQGVNETDGGGEEIPDGAEMTMSITFPGAVSEHNGTLEGTTVTWDLLTATEISARGSAKAGGGGIPLWIGIVVLALAAAGAVATVLIMKARQPASDAADAGATDAPAPTGEFIPGDGSTADPAEPADEAGEAGDESSGPEKES